MSNRQTELHVDLGPLEQLLQDPEVTEIMVNSTTAIYIEKHGTLIKTELKFESEEALVQTIKSIVEPLGRSISEDEPMIELRLPDNSRLNAVLRPIAITGPSLTLRKMAKKPLSWDDLIRYGSVTERVIEFLQACVRANLNIVVSGGTASGKTTIFNALSEFFPEDERIVTVEERAELQLRHNHVIALEANPPKINLAELIINAQFMRPDRIISGEVRGSEAWDMLQVMTMGYDGSMFTLHATTPQDALERIEMMCTAATNLPLLQIRSKIATGINLITQQTRLPEGNRKITHITEVIGMKNNIIETRNIFEYVQTGVQDARSIGETRLLAKPSFADRLGLPNDFWNLD